MITYRKLLQECKKFIDKQGEWVLDLPVLACHSAGGVDEAIYSPYLIDNADSEVADIHGISVGSQYVRFPIDH